LKSGWVPELPRITWLLTTTTRLLTDMDLATGV
jgi:hypothetical protein